MKLYSQSVSENSFFLRLDLNFLHFLDFSCRRRLLISDSNQVHFESKGKFTFLLSFPPQRVFIFFFSPAHKNILISVFNVPKSDRPHPGRFFRKKKIWGALNMSHTDENHFSCFFFVFPYLCGDEFSPFTGSHLLFFLNPSPPKCFYLVFYFFPK